MRSIESYLSIATAGGATWSPTSAAVAFAYDRDGFFQIYSVLVERDKILWPQRLTYESERCTNPHWLSDGTIAFTQDKGGNEHFQIGIINKDHEVSWISRDPDAKHIINFATTEHLYFIANIEEKHRLDLYRQKIPLHEHEPELLYRPEHGLASAQAVTAKEDLVIAQCYFGNNHQELMLIEPDDGSQLNLSRSISGMSKNRWTAVRLIDENSILVATDFGSDYLQLNILTLSAEILPVYRAILKMEFDGSAYASGSDRTYVAFNKNGYSQLFCGRFTASGVEDFHEIKLPRGSVITKKDSRSFSKGLSLSLDGRLLALTLSSSTSPANVWVCDTEDEHCWQATLADLAGVPTTALINETHHTTLSFDIRVIPYFKYLPQGERPASGWPAIMVVHGGPEAQFRPTFNPVIQFMLSNGFAVIAPNIRGSTGYGRKYMDLDNVDKRLDAIRDLKFLAMHLREEDPDIDGDRIVIYGASYGGFAVLSAMTEHPELWRAGVDIVGISNFITFLHNTAPWRRSLREAEYGSLEHDRAVLERISPINQIDKISAPLFIIQGANDERVPLSEAEQIYEAVRSRGVPVELLVLDDEGHGISRMENRIMVYSRIMNWLHDLLTK